MFNQETSQHLFNCCQSSPVNFKHLNKMMKISSILSVVLLIAAVSMTTVSGWTQLNVGDGGLSRWQSNCRYDGVYMALKPSSSEQCGGVCIAQPGCTHFTHGDGQCVMYNAPNGKELDHPVYSGWVCGYIHDRINWGR